MPKLYQINERSISKHLKKNASHTYVNKNRVHVEALISNVEKWLMIILIFLFRLRQDKTKVALSLAGMVCI